MNKKFLSLALVCTMTASGCALPSICGMDLPCDLTCDLPCGITVCAAADYGSEDLAAYAKQVAELVNKERAANGLSALKFSDKLSEAAIVRAQEIQTTFSHTRPDGTSCFTAMTEKGIKYTSAGENIAYGQKTPEAVMNSWMNSSGHRANILSKNYDYIGVGVTYKNGTYYWTQFFAKSSNLDGEAVTSNGNTTTTTTTTKTDTPAQTTTGSNTNTTTKTNTNTNKTKTNTTAKKSNVTVKKVTNCTAKNTAAAKTTSTSCPNCPVQIKVIGSCGK